jgi:hypothetical protein
MTPQNLVYSSAGLANGPTNQRKRIRTGEFKPRESAVQERSAQSPVTLAQRQPQNLQLRIKTSDHSNFMFPLVTWPPYSSTCANTRSAFFEEVKTHKPLEPSNKLEQRCLHLASWKGQQKLQAERWGATYIPTSHESLNYYGWGRLNSSDSE